MTEVFLGVGSNIDRESNLIAGLDALSALFGDLRTSAVDESEAIGFSGDPFLNMVVRAQSELAVGALQRALRDIEYAHGRPKNAKRFSSRRLDIDILLVGTLAGDIDGVALPRGEVLENAFVLRPLAELAPRHVHPTMNQTFSSLWASYDQPSQPLTRLALAWRGRTLGDDAPLELAS